MKTSHIERTNQITQILAEVCSYIKLCNSMGHFDTNLFLEDLVLILLNTIYGYQLENINHKFGKNNVKGIDLIDESNKICVQVSSRVDVGKIKKTVTSVAETKELNGFRLIYFALTDKSAHKNTQNLPYGNSEFSFSEDYFDFLHIIKVIRSQPDFSHKIYDILSNWIGNTPVSEFGKEYSVPQIEDLKRYYPRTVSIPVENEYKAFFEKELYPSDTLYNFISKKVKGYENNNLWLLVSAAQVGKSYEAIHLFRQLQLDDIHYPVFIKARDFDTDKEVIALPFYAPIHKMVLIVDGFDELPENKRNTLHKLLENLNISHPTLTIIITCRRNYVNISMFTNFQRLNLEDLSLDEIKEISENNAIDFNLFSKELIEKNLWELVFIPFFLESLISIYKTEDCLPSDRMSIIRTIISQSYAADDSANPTADISSETYGNSMLSKIAFVLQLSEQKELTEIELMNEFKYSNEELSRCLRFAIFKRSEDKKYSFTKNIFLNYFVVHVLLKKTSDEILKLIVLHDAKYSCINPAWLDVFELLIVSLDKRSDTYKQLVEWIYCNDQMSIIGLDPHSLPKTVVMSTFKDLLMKYKRLRISGPNDLNYKFHKELANHCIYRESLELVISEYKTLDLKGGYAYLLCSIIAYLDSDVIQAFGQYSKLVDATLENIKTHAYRDTEVWYIYVPLKNKIFHNARTVDSLIDLYSSTNGNLLKEIFSLISKLKDVDSYIDFIANNIDDYRCFTDKKGVSHPVDDELIDIIFSKIKKAHNLPVAIDCLTKKWIDERGLISSEKKAYKSLINLLNVADQHIENNPDLIGLIELFWQKILIKRVLSGELLLNAFYAIKGLVIKYNKTDKPSIIIQDMRACLGKENCGLELRNSRAIILLYLSPKEVDRIASDMDCSAENSIILNWVKSGLDPNIDDCVDLWLNTKFEQFNNNHEIDWIKHEEESKQVLVDHELFISTIKDLLDKSGDTPVSIYFDNLEKRDIPTNTYVYWFCKSIEDELNSDYTATALIAKAQDRQCYDIFRIDIIGSHNLSIELSLQQLEDLKKAINTVIENASEAEIITCLKIAIKYDIKLSEQIIINNLKYAALTPNTILECDSPDNLLSYAIRHLGRKAVNNSIPLLLENPIYHNEKYSILQLITYAIKNRLFVCMPQIMSIICNDKFYYSNTVVDTLNSIGPKGVHIIKENFSAFPPKLQLYSLRYVKEYGDMQEEIISCMKKIRLQDSEEDSRMALFYLLSIGYEDSLIDLLDICQNNPAFLGDLFDAPILNYTSIEDLSTLLDILRITHNFTARFNHWPSQCIRAIKHIALIKDENTDIVIDSLRNLVSESPDYIWINYQIESIQQERLQRHSYPLSIKDAIKLIDSEF